MFADFDLHPDSGLLAIRHFKDREQSEITLWDIGSRTRLADIGRGPGPQRPRVSPDGTQIVFFDNTGRLYSHSVTDRETDLLVDWPGRFAVFPSWSPDSRSLAFASHGGTNPETDTPPKLFWLNLPDRHIEPITHKGGARCRWFPSVESVRSRATLPTEVLRSASCVHHHHSHRPDWIYQEAVADSRRRLTSCRSAMLDAGRTARPSHRDRRWQAGPESVRRPKPGAGVPV